MTINKVIHNFCMSPKNVSEEFGNVLWERNYCFDDWFVTVSKGYSHRSYRVSKEISPTIEDSANMLRKFQRQINIHNKKLGYIKRKDPLQPDILTFP